MQEGKMRLSIGHKLGARTLCRVRGRAQRCLLVTAVLPCPNCHYWIFPLPGPAPHGSMGYLHEMLCCLTACKGLAGLMRFMQPLHLKANGLPGSFSNDD
eukprot:1161075-Pelagomonas_calceolata.AAC.8